MRVPAYLLVLLAGVAACAGPPAPRQEAASLQHAAGGGRAASGVVTLSGAGEFTAGDTAAIAYDRKLAPAGAQASVTTESRAKQTRTSLVVEGMLPNHHYGAHIHARPCGRAPDDSGPHYQHHPGRIDPASESWLDVTTDGEGRGRSATRHDWALDPARLPGSLVIHAKPTITSGPRAGQAGDRIACLTLR